MQKNNNISMSVIRRLPRYYRFLGELLESGIDRISSKELADIMDFSASQIRQDFNCFGGFGQQGYGYNVDHLRQEIGKILGLNNLRDAVLIGVGNLGRAVATYTDFKQRGFNLIGAFDKDPKIIGQTISNVIVKNIDEILNFCAKNKPDIAILCVPESSSKQLVGLLIQLGIKAFWNFSHYDISHYHQNVIVENVHLSDSLMTLCYKVNNV